MGAKNRIDNHGKEEHRSLWKMLQGPFRDTVRARSLVDLETPDGFVNLFRVG